LFELKLYVKIDGEKGGRRDGVRVRQPLPTRVPRGGSHEEADVK